MLKVRDFTKNKLCCRHFDNILQKIFRTNILGIGRILLIVVLMISLWLKVQMEMVNYNDSIFTSFPSSPIFVLVLRTVMYQSAEAHHRPSQARKLNLFATITNVFKLTLLTIFVKKWVFEEL